MSNLLFTCNAILPIVLVILLGYYLKKLKFFNENFFKIANKLVFTVFIPFLLFYNIYNIDSFENINWSFMLYVSLSLILLFLIGLVIVAVFVKDYKQKGVVLQCAFRSNYAIIGIPLATQLGASETAIAVASITSAFCVPIFNILGVIALSIYADDSKIDFKKILIKILKNPLIIGVSIGLAVCGIRILLQNNDIDFTIKDNLTFLYTSISSVASLATPLALILLGGGFTFKAISKLKFQIILGTSMRVVLVPVLALIMAYLLGYRENEFPTLIALFGTPCAVSSVAMAKQMNADDELAGQLVVWTTIISIISLFIIILICNSGGLFG